MSQKQHEHANPGVAIPVFSHCQICQEEIGGIKQPASSLEKRVGQVLTVQDVNIVAE